VTGQAGPASGAVKVRLLGAACDIQTVADLLTTAGGGQPPVVSFVRTDRECSPVRTALGQPEPWSMFARSDRARGLGVIGSDERRVNGPGQRLRPARWPGAVRTHEHQPRGDEAAVARDEQLRSELANKTTPGRDASRAAGRGGWQVTRRSAPCPNRRAPGARLYLTLTITAQAGGPHDA
jgi:hypothetical protein